VTAIMADFKPGELVEVRDPGESWSDGWRFVGHVVEIDDDGSLVVHSRDGRYREGGISPKDCRRLAPRRPRGEWWPSLGVG